MDLSSRPLPPPAEAAAAFARVDDEVAAIEAALADARRRRVEAGRAWARALPPLGEGSEYGASFEAGVAAVTAWLGPPPPSDGGAEGQVAWGEPGLAWLALQREGASYYLCLMAPRTWRGISPAGPFGLDRAVRDALSELAERGVFPIPRARATGPVERARAEVDAAFAWLRAAQGRRREAVKAAVLALPTLPEPEDDVAAVAAALATRLGPPSYGQDEEFPEAGFATWTFGPGQITLLDRLGRHGRSLHVTRGTATGANETYLPLATDPASPSLDAGVKAALLWLADRDVFPPLAELPETAEPTASP